MKKLIVLLFTLVLTLSAFSRPANSFDGMNKKEIKQLLVTQNDEKVRKHIKVYAHRKVGGISLLIISVISAFFAKGKTRQLIETSDSLSAPVLTASSLAFIAGILLLVTADNAFDRSKEAYLNPNPICIQLNLNDTSVNS